jgi:UDP-2-acetamido-2,6-beta-L-arabino-hexul-4-ose reductase
VFRNLGLNSEDFKVIEFNKEYFNQEVDLDKFVSQCDVIVHLASKNRHEDPEILYQTNVDLTKKLVSSLIRVSSKAHVIFSSSTQEDNGSPYGRSKTDARNSLVNWASETQGAFTGLIIPNVFGPFCNPYYNSVTATFSHQLVNNEPCKIQVDSVLRLIYVDELIKHILEVIQNQTFNSHLQIDHTYEIRVSDLLKLLQNYKGSYLDQGVIPLITNSFELNLFNTFRSYINIQKHFPRKYIKHTDPRGVFSELIRLYTGGQVSYSETLPGMTRGNHFHTRKIERFAVIKGEAIIQLRKIGAEETIDLYLSGKDSAYVDMPIWYTHNIKNVGIEELYTIFWINEFYDPNDSDTYFENV